LKDIFNKILALCDTVCDNLLSSMVQRVVHPRLETSDGYRRPHLTVGGVCFMIPRPIQSEVSRQSGSHN
jgi:hypothetical protein